MAVFGRYGRCGHTLAGVSDGPCSGAGQTNFNTPKPYEEVLKAARACEEHGNLTPKKEATFRKMLAMHKGKDYGKVDYQKTGHPLNDRK